MTEDEGGRKGEEWRESEQVQMVAVFGKALLISRGSPCSKVQN